MNKKFKYLLVLLLMLFLVPINVLAKNLIELKVDKTDLKVGDEIIVTANVPNKMETYAIMATLQYDKNVFQAINDSNFIIKNDESIKYSNETNKFGIINKTGKIVLNDGDTLFTVHLKVKNDALVGNTNIALTNINYTDGNEIINLPKTSIKVLVTKDAKDDETIPSNNENNIVEDEESTIKVISNLPFITILGILVVIGLIIILYMIIIKKSHKNKKKSIYYLIALEIILALTTSILLWLNINKNDVNNDGITNYHDAEEIIDYLINIEGTKKEDNKSSYKNTNKKDKPVSDYDVNNDGNVDIQDVENTIEQIEKNTKVKLKEEKDENEYYLNKGKITLKFTAEIEPKEVKITKAKVDGKYYDVEFASGVYIVTIDNINTAGVHNFVIEEVKLTNGVKRKTNLKITKEILKDIPEVKDLQHDIKDGKLSFTIDDKDKALQNAQLTIFEGNITEEDFNGTNSNNDENELQPDDFDKFKIVFEQELDITNDLFTFKPELELGGSYLVVVTGTYDLDSVTGDNKNDYQEKFLNNGLKNITIGKVTIKPKNTEEIFLTQNTQYEYLFDVNFEPKNIAQDIKKVLIGEEYKDVTYENGHLKLKLDNTLTPGVKNINISALVLNDGTEILCQHEIKYDVLKEVPKINNFVYHKDNGKISFILNDKDNAIKEASIRITNSDNEEVYQENLNLNNKEYNIIKKLKEGNTYNITIIGNYDLDSDTDNGKNNGLEKFEHQLTVYNVELLNASNEEVYYAEKGSEVSLKFKTKITPLNDNAKVTNVTIDGTTYVPKKEKDGTYSITIKVPTTSQEKIYKLTNIILDDEELANSLELKVDILKDIPRIENLLIDESKAIPEVSFNLIDSDNALEENAGNLIITNKDGKTVKYAINKNKNIIKLDLKELEGGIYDLDIVANYNRHNCNNATKYVVKNKKLIDTKEIKIYNATLNLATYNKFAKKGEERKFKLNSTITPNDGVTIKSFVLEDGQIINPTKVEKNTYTINLTMPENYGSKTFAIKKVILSNDIEISTTFDNISMYILKDIPYINKLNLSEDNKSISYELADLDSAFIDGKISIIGKNNQSISENIQKSGKAKINYDFQDDEIYLIKVYGSYDLDSKENTGKNEFINQEMSSQSFIVGGSYNFTLNNVSITDAIKQAEKPIITFKSTNSRSTIVNKANLKIDNKDVKQYPVEKIDKDTYQIILNDADINFGKHKVIFESVSMNNGAKTFTNGNDFNTNELTYIVLKEAPSLKSLSLNTDKTNKTITAKFTLNNPDYALRKLNVILVESNGKIVANRELMAEEFVLNDEINVELSYKGSTDGRYTVRVLADYELADKYLYINENIGEDSILVYSNEEIRIDKMYVVNNKNEEQVEGLYPTKNQKDYQIALEVYIADSVKARGYSRVSGVTINGVNYPAHQISGYKSKVYINIPKEAGIIKLTANRVQLANDGYYRIYNDYYSVSEKTLTLDVLKDKPKIENLEIKENYQNKEVTFNFDVVLDNTAKNDEFTDGTITFDKEEKEIVKGKNSITFKNVTIDKTFDLIFKGTYDLDSNQIEGISDDKNKTVKGEFYTIKYGLYNTDIYNSINITTETTEENDKHYYEKNEEIKLKLNINGIDENLGVIPSKVIVNNKEYTLTNIDNEYYELVLEGYSSSGEKNITINDIILSNSKKVKLSKPYSINVEVLKDIPKLNDYNYTVNDKNITINFALKDSDAAIIGHANILVTDELGNELYNVKYQDKVVIDLVNKDILRYYVKVITDYDRDIDKSIDSDNYSSKVTLLNELISLEKNNIELKDITDINVYKKEIENGEEIISLKDEIVISDIKKNKDDYFVKVSMENLPDAYVEIKDIIDKDNKLTLVLKYEYVTKEGSDKEQTIRIDFGTIKNGISQNEFHPKDAFRTLLEKLENGESVTLEKDYDASSIKVGGNTYVTNDYAGNLNGNGHTIKNLSKPLFNQIKGTIENLKIKDVTLDSNGHGALANNTTGATITKVLVDKVTKTATSNGNNGGLIGLADNTKVTLSRATNVLLNLGYYEQQNGTFIGHTQNNSIVENCYAEGKLVGGWNYTSGFIGNAQNTTVTNNYLKVTTQGQTSGATAFADAYNNRNSVYKNNICIATGTNGNFAGSYKSLENNYFYQTNSATKEADGVNIIDEKDITNELFTNAKFDTNIWKIKNISIDNLPIFQIENVSVLNDLSSELYNEENEVLYSNLMKLMPFFDSEKIIKSSEKISKDNILVTKNIKHIVPIDQNGNIITYLTTDNPKKISKLKIAFTDGTKEEYSVIYDKTYDMVASYKINELGIDYNYKNYVINSSSQVIVNLTNYLKNLDYTNNLDILTTNDDSRLYRDFYNENTKNNLEEFVLKYLSNSEYTNTSGNESINNYIEKEVKAKNKIVKALYVYNYFKRFYDLDINGMKVYDFIMFNMEGFDESLTVDKIVDLYFAKTNGENFNTNQTNTRYNEVLSKYTKLDTIPKFIEYLVSKFSDIDLPEWTRNQFKGIIEEIPLESAPNVKYTLWDHFISETNNEILNQFLPMLTLPENAAYIISMPVQYIIGAQRTYIVDPSNPKESAALKEKMGTYIVRMKRYFETAYSILQDEKLFNDILIYSVDKRLTKTENGSVTNNAYTTTEPFHKNFVEATGLWAAAAGVNAAAWGPRLEWQVAGILDSTLADEGYNDTSHVTFRTWSHESAHLIDARLFLRNNGRRFDAGGEDYADNFLMQSFDRNSITMNLSMMMDKTASSVAEATEAKLGPVASNLTPERIDSPEKIQDFYRKLFETVYVMDYIEAQAFLQLPLETQKILGIQVSYPNEDKQFAKVVGADGKDTNEYEGEVYKNDIYAKYRARETTKYTRLNELPEFNTPLRTIDDLINNRIMLYPGVYRYSSRGNNSYGGEGINTVHWYQPNNPDGRPDSYALKWISYEMLGWKGYNDGFVEYASNINYTKKEIYKDLSHPKNGLSTVNYKSDSMALKQISNNQFSSFSEYKKYRFNDIKDKLNRLDSEINVNEYINKFVEALKQDANDITDGVQKELTKNPNCPSDYWCSRGQFATYLSYQYSTKIRHEIYYKLKTKTNDFRTEIFR